LESQGQKNFVVTLEFYNPKTLKFINGYFYLLLVINIRIVKIMKLQKEALVSN